jgi:hypothetical protein
MTNFINNAREGNPMSKLYRQGDVLIREVTEIPNNLNTVPRDAGRVVLAYGEVTGHAHAITDPAVSMCAADIQDLTRAFLEIEASVELVEAWECEKDGQIAFMAGYQPQEVIEKAGYTVKGRQTIPGAVVAHEEHLHMVVPPGSYEVRRQREYQPAAPVWVAD